MSPSVQWLTLKQAGARVHRSPRFLRREIDAGRLRAAHVGGRREVLLCDEWLNAWVEQMATPVPVTPRRLRA
jgi:hypothetical protein